MDAPGLEETVVEALDAFRELVSSKSFGEQRLERHIGAREPDRKLYRDFTRTELSKANAEISTLYESISAHVAKEMIGIRAFLGLSNFDGCPALMDLDTGPILRMTYYPPSPGCLVSASHADIDLFTLLPKASRSGLELLRSGAWERVDVPKNTLLCVPGEMAQLLGGRDAVLHRVVGSEAPRISASFFVNANRELRTQDGLNLGTHFDARISRIQQELNSP